MKVWIISDTHWNHLKMIEYCGRPPNFNDLIIKNWKKLVKEDDIVIHLGDVILGRNSELKGILTTLPGKKVLCRGNHDHEGYLWYMERGFDFVCDYFILDNIAFSHAPLTPLPLQTIKQHSKDKEFFHKEVDLNIHGHLHRPPHRTPKEGESPETFKDRYYDYHYFKKNKEKYHLIQIEDELRPFSLEEIVQTHGKNN